MDRDIGQSDLGPTPRGVAQLSQGTLTDKALRELARIEREFLAEAVKLRERRGSWDRLATLYEMMDALAAELSTLCRVLGFLSPWAPQVRNGEPTLAVLKGELVDPATTSLWKFPTLKSSIEWLDGQQVLSYPEYRALAEADRKNAFSIPPVRKIETLNVLKGALVDSFARGESVADFTRTARTIVSAQTHAIERTYRTKSKQAYLQGVDTLTRSPRVRDRFPWVKYVATTDNRTRPTHRAQDGKIARVGSPEAAEFRRLQEEYNCRCTLIPLTNAMAEREGVEIPEDGQPPREPQRLRIADEPLLAERDVRVRGFDTDLKKDAPKLKLTEKKLVEAFNPPTGSDVRYVADGKDQVRVFIEHPKIEGPAVRVIKKDSAGKTVVENEFIKLKETGTGFGSRMFADQVEGARAAGVARITTKAQRSDTWGGYYTWPRLGYDGVPNWKPGAPAKFTKLKSLLDVMETPEGRAAWKEFGDTVNLTFDLTPGSRSLRTLENYLRETGT